MYDPIPFLNGIQILVGATEHLVQRLIGVTLASVSVENADSDLGALENGSKELLACLQGFLRACAFRNVFGQAYNALGSSGCIPEQLELSIAKDNAAVPANEALLIFIRLPFPLYEFRIPLSAGVRVLPGDDRVPVLQAAQFLSRVIEHFHEAHDSRNAHWCQS